LTQLEDSPVDEAAASSEDAAPAQGPPASELEAAAPATELEPDAEAGLEAGNVAGAAAPDDVAAGGEYDGEPEGRCEAETTVGGTLYRCALDSEHEGEHAFSAVDSDDELDEAGDGSAPETPEDVAKAQAKLDNEAIRHANRLRQILGSDADGLVVCALCSPRLAGWRYDVAPSAEQDAAVRILLGLPDLSNLRPSPTEAVCDTCGGLGRVRTFALVPGEESKKCDPCNGKGWVTTRPRSNPDESAPPAEPGAPPVLEPVADGVERDMFGTPKGDPDYGLLPGLRARPTEYWQTHRV
jgi:hypothetical protein